MSLPKLTPADPDRITNYFSQTSWLIRDPARFMALLDEASRLVHGGYFCGDNFFTWGRSNSCFDDAAFRQAWESNCVVPTDRVVVWRRYIAATLAFNAVALSGDFVECGAYMGTAVKTVMDYLGGKEFPRTFWAYDTFDSNPVPGYQYPGQEPGLFEKVQQRFEGYPQVKLVKGLIPEIFATHCPERIAFLHIDLNHAEAEVAVLEALFDRVVPGGVVLFDDYEWAAQFRLQKIAEDAWLDRRGYRVSPFPTGQGLVIKH